jgi:hypothetical protein
VAAVRIVGPRVLCSGHGQPADPLRQAERQFAVNVSSSRAQRHPTKSVASECVSNCAKTKLFFQILSGETFTLIPIRDWVRRQRTPTRIVD